MRSFYGFAIVGAIGFIVHAAGVTFLVVDRGFDPTTGWLLAFAAAVTVTWLLNRAFVFRSARPQPSRTLASYGRYVLVQAGGAMVNLLVFSLLIHLYPSLKATPVVPVAGGSIVALFFNFAGAKWWAFVPVEAGGPPDASTP